jgi:hypothetical protein
MRLSELTPTPNSRWSFGEAEDDLYSALFSPDAYAIGVKVAVRMMSH